MSAFSLTTVAKSRFPGYRCINISCNKCFSRSIITHFYDFNLILGNITVSKYLKEEEYDLDALNAELYAIPKMVYGEDRPDIKKLQREFFKIDYKLLIAKEKGPRLYLFLYAIEKER